MKTKNIIIAGLAGLLLAACTEDVVEQKMSMTSSYALKIEVSDNPAATRADYSGFPSTTFETGDAIGLYAFDGSSYVVSNIRFVKQSDGSWLPDEEVPYVEDYTYYAYFPYSEDAYTPSTSGTVNDIDTKFDSFITDASNYFWQADQSTKAGYTYSNLMIAKGTITDADDDAVTIKFTMAHKRGLAVFTGDASEATFTGNIPYLIGDTKQFLMKPSAATSFTDNRGTYSMTASAGEYATHNIILTIDLSMVDNAGNDRVSMNTANCYMVHSAGKYKLPLVYGNAIKDGEVNTIAFYPGKDGSIADGTDRFVNHSDDGITGPWITRSGSGVDAGMGLTAASAELLWQDANGLISAVGVDGDYLTFTVGTFNAGNALIAVKDGSGTILWSWHIWATAETLTSTTTVATGTHNYVVAPVNLGWVPTGGDGKQGYCPYYQWGRKDPFIPAAAYNSSTNHTVYNISGTSVTGINYSGTGVTIADNIKNPTTHYYYSSNNGPVTTTYYNMWDAQNTATNNVTTATNKTIYDPCPPGFCVPTENLWYYFENGSGGTMSTFDSTNEGATWNTGITGSALWFTITDFRSKSNGTISRVHNGFYWSATPSSTDNGFCLSFGSSNWAEGFCNRAYGFQVRPVAEE